MKVKILLIEDEPNVVSVIQRGLGESGFSLSVAFDGLMGLQMFKKASYDAIILDLMLPGMNGIQVCQEIRATDRLIPIVMLTALDSTDNVVNGLENGADDYMVKPFKIAELTARLRTLLRRRNAPTQQCHIFKIDDLELDLDSKILKRGGRDISLTSTEYRLLEFFVKNAGKVLSRVEILENVWNIDFNMGTNVVDVYVNYLRKKLDPEDTANRLIHTVFGMGYVLKQDH